LKYNKKLDPTASTIDTDKYINDEFKTYVENSNILRILQMQLEQNTLKSELEFNLRIDSITNEEMDQIIDKELKLVDRIIHEMTTWKMGMCMLDYKQILCN